MGYHDLSQSQRTALLRQLRGDELGARAQRSLRQGLARSARVESARARQDKMDMGGRRPRPGVGGAAPTPRSPTGKGPASLAGGGGALLPRPAFDARQASAAEVNARLHQLGLVAHLDDHAANKQQREMAKPPSPSLVLAERQQRAKVTRREAIREKRIQAGAIDGRQAKPAEIQARLHVLLGRPTAASFRPDFREAGKPLPVAEPPPSASAIEDAAEQTLVRKIEEAKAAGQRIDARRLSPEELRLLYAARGLAAPSGWGAPTPGASRGR